MVIDPVRDPDGTLIGFAKITRDITERKQAQIVQASEGQFRSFAQSMANQVWAADGAGKLNWFSERALSYIGLSYEELAGDGWVQAVHPEDLGQAAPLWAASVASGELYETEFRIRRADGVYRWHLVRAAAIRDDAGNVVRWVGTNTDIEQDRQIRAKLSETQSELSILLNSAASAFYSVAQDGSTTSCNAAFLNLLGFSETAEVIGKALHGVIHHTHPDGSPYPREDCPIYLCAQVGTETYVPEELFFRKDGTPVPVEYWVRPIYREGTLAGAICNFNDITERKQADEQRLLLIGELNHRVKNLFALVNGIVSLSAREAGSSKELADALQGRFSALSRAHELIQPGLRSVGSSVNDGIDFADLLTQIFSPYLLLEQGERIKIEGPAITLSADAVTGMALIFHELATNSSKYGALKVAEGRITVRWYTHDGILKLEWMETGYCGETIAPRQTGFGSVLLRRSIEGQFGGTVSYDWRADGLCVAIAAPFSRFALKTF